jgi:hypothetical protein
MELKKVLKRSSKAQLMTIIMLILFLLILAELFTLALLNITSDETMQSFSLSFASSNYGNLLRLSANNFAKESLSRAISSLATYEYTPALRRGNFISNTTFYISNMIISGILPNDISGYPQIAMGNLTLAIYNNSIASLFNFAAPPVIVNETKPVIFQPDPYHIGVSYIERISINSSGNNYRYNIPVNVSISINNTPDLLYAQQGIQRNIKFANLTNVTSIIGGVHAASGNAVAYAYGAVYNLPSSSTNGATCPSNPSYNSMNQNTILVTYNAIGLEGCMNNYAGLISYIAPSALPTVPYLLYSAPTNVLQSLQSGQKVLIYGPGFETLNIEGLRTAIMNGYYFSSPFAPSYLDLAQDNIDNQSPNGIFTFSNYNTQSANFDGMTSNIILGYDEFDYPVVTVCAWIKTSAPMTSVDYRIVTTGSENTNAWLLTVSYTAGGEVAMSNIQTGSKVTTATTNIAVNDGKWHQVCGISNPETVYLDGNMQSSKVLDSWSFQPNSKIGSKGDSVQVFPGAIANVQIYSNALTSSQINMLYSQGIGSLPISSNIVGWYPLNGNANDYSGNGQNGAANVITYTLLANYTRDSIFNIPASTPLSPLPGVLSCNSNSQCSSSSLPHLFLGYSPLEQQNRFLQSAYFSTMSGCAGSQGYVPIVVSSIGQPTLGALTMAWWINPLNPDVLVHLYSKEAVPGGAGPYCTATTCDVFSTSGNAIAPSTVPNNAWSFLALTLSSTGPTATYYLNGNPGTPATWNGLLTGIHDLDFLGYEPGCADSTQGYMSNFQLYNAALSANQVNQLYQEGIAGLPFLSNLIGWWPLNGDAKDYSGFINNGIATNVMYPYFPSTYIAPGMSSIAATANEWQALGLANT